MAVHSWLQAHEYQVKRAHMPSTEQGSFDGRLLTQADTKEQCRNEDESNIKVNQGPIWVARARMGQAIQGASNGTGGHNCVRQASALLQGEANYHIQQRDIEGSATNSSRVGKQCTLHTGSCNQRKLRGA